MSPVYMASRIARAAWFGGRSRVGPQHFETVPNFSLIEGYRRLSLLDMIRQRKMPLLTVQASRGCQFKCNFCIVNTMFEAGYRKRDIESVIRDLRDKRKYGRELLFVDNDFAAIRSYTKKLLQRMIEEDFGFDIMVLTRIEVTKDDELLALMRRAGQQVYQGYESVQPETLVGYDKKQTLEKIVAAIDKLHTMGFRISGSFVIGADTDTLDTIERSVSFVLDQNLTIAYFFPVWGHYPEQIRYKAIVPWYRSIFHEWNICDGNFVTHFPLKMRPSQLQRALSKRRGGYSLLRALWMRCGAANRRTPRRNSPTVICGGRFRKVCRILPFLEELEEGLYDESNTLNEVRLVERVRADGWWTFKDGNRAIRNSRIVAAAIADRLIEQYHLRAAEVERRQRRAINRKWLPCRSEKRSRYLRSSHDAPTYTQRLPTRALPCRCSARFWRGKGTT